MKQWLQGASPAPTDTELCPALGTPQLRERDTEWGWDLESQDTAEDRVKWSPGGEIF